MKYKSIIKVLLKNDLSYEYVIDNSNLPEMKRYVNIRIIDRKIENEKIEMLLDLGFQYINGSFEYTEYLEEGDAHD